MYIVDRFEGEWAIIETENRETFRLPKQLLQGAKEGDVIAINIVADKVGTEKRRSAASAHLSFDE